MRRSAFRRMAWLLVPVLAGACAAATPSGKGGGPAGSPAIGDLLASPASFAGAPVTLEAAFVGWSGACPSPPPRGRSDWMVEDSTGCLYVHGPLPAGLSALKPSREPVTVRGVVRLDRGGRPFLELPR